jgi:uncharacterized iron-regulated membrane protein
MALRATSARVPIAVPLSWSASSCDSGGRAPTVTLERLRRVRWQWLNRQVHYWVGIAIAVPVLVVLTSGILLQLKKQWAWIQPPEQIGIGTAPRLAFSDLLAASRTVPQAGVRTWADIDRIDVRPQRGVAKVTSRTHWEIQVDTETAEVLQVAKRRSDLLESIHDGSWFHPHAKLWIFLPSGVLLLALWVTGVYLAWLPFQARARRGGRVAASEGVKSRFK